MDIAALTDFFLYTLAGAGVGFVVGLTGVGGGSLMTPLLIMFNFPPHIAIGTDLVFAAATKGSGTIFHAKQKSVDWRIFNRLCLGSIPASLLTIGLLSYFFENPASYQSMLITMLGIMLILSGLVIFFKSKLNQSFDEKSTGIKHLERSQGPLTIFAGFLLGVCVTLTSVGAGALGAACLMMLYPKLKSVNIIGTDIAHAVPLTLIAGIGHMQLGNVDYLLLFSLLLGSIPTIHFGTKLSKQIPNQLLQPLLASLLFIIGIKYAFF